MKLSNVFDDDRQKILEIALFMSMKPDQLNENTGKGALRMAKRAGLKITNGRGLVSILSKAGKYMAEVMYYAFKAHGGDKEARNQLKELMKKRVSKEEFVDFLEIVSPPQDEFDDPDYIAKRWDFDWTDEDE